MYRAATTNYLCCVPTLEDSKGAGRTRLAHISIADAKVVIYFENAKQILPLFGIICLLLQR